MAAKTKFQLTDRKFGVEIEFFGNAEVVAAKAQELGLDVRVENYNHQTRTWWKIVTDSSAEFELVSPILQGEDGMRQLELASKALNLTGAQVNRKCGLHVHHDASDLDRTRLNRIVAFYMKFEKVIDLLVSPSRRGDTNTYCRSLCAHNRTLASNLEQLGRMNARDYILSLEGGPRYHKVNLEAFLVHGTVEFRQHQGTTEFEKMQAWVILTQSIVEKSEEAISYKLKGSLSYKLFREMLGAVGQTIEGERAEAAAKFLVERFKEFSGKRITDKIEVA